MLENPSPRTVNNFERIKRIPVPYEDIDEGIRDVCKAINGLPYAITTERSGDTREFVAQHSVDDGFALLKHGHIAIVFNEHDQRSHVFVSRMLDIASHFSEVEVMPMLIDHEDEAVTFEMCYEIRVKRSHSLASSNATETGRRELLKRMENLPDNEALAEVHQFNTRAQQIPKDDVERKISQFKEFKQRLTELALESAVDN